MASIGDDSAFAETVEKLSKATDKLDKAAESMDAAGGGDGGAAAAEIRRDEKDRAEKTNEYLKDIVGILSKVDTGGSGPSDAEQTSGGIFASIARALGGVGAGIGKAVGGFMNGIAGAALKGPLFVAAMTALGLGLAAFMAAVAGGAWLAAKTFPDIAESLKSFEGIDGKNLKDVGAGMAALGVGMGATGLGGAISSVGNLVGSMADGIGKLFGVESGSDSLFTKMEAFGKIKVNKENIQNNAEAMISYGKAMAMGGGGKVLGAVATLAEGVFGGIGKALGGIPPMESLVAFSKHVIDGDQVKLNAEAMMHYAKAMTLGAAAKGMEAIASLGNIVTSVADGISKMVGGKGTLDSQLEGLKKLSAATGIDKDKVKSVAGAMVFYAAAMIAGAPASLAQGAASLGNLVTSVSDGLSKLVGGKGTLDTQLAGLKKMTDASAGIDAVKVANIATAMSSYAKAMLLGAGATTGGAVASIANFVGGAVKALGSFFGIKDRDPLAELKKFSEFIITDKQVTQILLNAKAIGAYASAMGELGKINLPENFADTISSIMDGIGGFFSKKKDPMLALEKFSKAKVDPIGVKKNVEALNEFAKLGAGFKGRLKIARFAEDIVKGLPALEMAIMGGKVEGSFLPSWLGGSKSKVLKGLADSTIDYEGAQRNMNLIKSAMSQEIEEVPGKATPVSESADLAASTGKAGTLWQSGLQKSIENLALAIQGAGGGTTTIARGGDQVDNRRTNNAVINKGSSRDVAFGF